ncbi:uncharacterized protein LOC107874264 [Capsicum annuum]|uniref:uncharacterized protein LOC107874264 n=1 Tax=Capsicum annuum TaxID=4072 RepID=UPI0007BFDEB7|nr:uncharacterized protein LOC107874264 [Capsicum annuum]
MNHQKIKTFVSAGSLVALQNKQILQQKKKKKNTGTSYVNAKENHHKQKEKLNNVPVRSQVQEQVQWVFEDPILPVAPVEEQVSQELLYYTTRASQPSLEQVQQDQLEIPKFEANEQFGEGSSINKNKGATQMAAVHRRTECQLIVLNKLNRRIGPTKAVVTKFSSFLGTLARNGIFCPLNISWAKLKTHDDMWSYIQEKYDIHENGKKWAMNEIGASFRGYKTRFKNDQYYVYPNNEIRKVNRPKTILEPVFADLLQYWNSNEAKDKSDANKQN